MAASKRTQHICVVDFDTAQYVGDESDGVYYAAAQGPDGQWYTSAVVDCNSASFTDALFTDDGPYATEADALSGGRNGAADWCFTNGVSMDSEVD